MSKLVITAIFSSDMSQTGKVLVNNPCINQQIGSLSPINGYIQIVPEDLAFITRLIASTSIPFCSGKEILWAILRNKKIGKISKDSLLNQLFNDENNAKVGDYELCLHFNVHTDRIHNCRFIGIDGCSMRYHFSDLINFNEEKISKIGLEKGYTSEHGRYSRESEWIFASLFQLMNRSDIYAHSIFIRSYLTKCVIRSWTLFFDNQVKEAKRSRNYFWRKEFVRS